MSRTNTIVARFVDTIPGQLDPATIYISITYKTAIHQCCCGCGTEVVTPFSPTDWRLVFDGASVSLEPSVGNWSLPCRSHYWIRRNQVVWAGNMTPQQIQRGRDHDRAAKRRHYGDGEA